MKTLLINGCSFGECWSPSDKFVEALGCDNVVNISKTATSVQRTLRSTIEWIAQNGNPHYVITPITFAHRWELAINKDEDKIDGSWFPIQRPELLESLDRKLHPDVDKNRLSAMIESYYALSPTIRSFWDKLFTNVLCLSSFLENRNVKHLIFDMCNDFDMTHIASCEGFEKLKLLEQNKSVINLFGFCGNKYMWDSLKEKEKIDFNMHHAPEQYLILEDFLLKYIEKQ